MDQANEVGAAGNADDEMIANSASQPLFWQPFLYGSSAVAIKKPDSDHTHKWTIFVRGYQNEDISPYVRKVIFKLHESFLQPNRGIL